MKKLILGLLILLSIFGVIWCGETQEEMLLRGVRTSDISVVEKAIANGANLDFCDANDKTVLMYACEKINYPMVKKLLESGANVSAKNTSGQTAIMIAAKEVNDIKFIKLLKEFGANLNVWDNQGKTVLMYASENQSDVIVNFLIKEGVDLNPKDMFGNNAAMWAAKTGNIYTLNAYMRANAINWDQCDEDGNDVFMLACLSGNINLVKRLLVGNTDFSLEKNNSMGEPYLIRLIRKKASNAIIGLVMDQYDPKQILYLQDVNNHDLRYWAKRTKNGYVTEKLDEIEKEWR